MGRPGQRLGQVLARLVLPKVHPLLPEPAARDVIELALDALPEGYDAWCICTGTPDARNLDIPGRELRGIHFALEFLAQQNRVLAGQTFSEEQRVTAKGKGSIGARIIEVAKENNIPIEENEVLAGALANVEIGDEIPTELYKAVAEVLGFVLGLSRRMR